MFHHPSPSAAAAAGDNLVQQIIPPPELLEIYSCATVDGPLRHHARYRANKGSRTTPTGWHSGFPSTDADNNPNLRLQLLPSSGGLGSSARS